MDTTALIQAIEAHAAKRNLAPATITSRAVHNSRLYRRLKDGKTCTMKTAREVLDYIAGDEAGAS